MSVSLVGTIEYQPAPSAGAVRFQTDPPVCTHCQREITRQNFGWAYVMSEGRLPEQFEIIECTECTMIREGGPSLTRFLARHKL